MKVIKMKNVVNAIRQVQATSVRQNFQEVIDTVHYTKEALVISKHSKPWVIIQPLSEEQKSAQHLGEAKS